MLSCLAAFLFCGTAYAQVTVAGDVPILGEIKKSSRKPFIYNVGVSAGHGLSFPQYTAVNTDFYFTCNSFRLGGYFEWQAFRFLRRRLNVGMELGYCHGVYTMTDYLMQKDFKASVGNVRFSPYVSYNIRPFCLVAGIDGRIPVGFTKEKGSIALSGINRDCLRGLVPGIYGAVGFDFRSLHILAGFGYDFGTGIFDLDRLSYYKRSSFQYSLNDNFSSFFLVRIPVFGNGR